MPTLNGVPLSCEEILDRYGALVYRLAVQGTGSPVDGEDVAQEVFVSLIQSDPRFADELHLRAWLVRATTNRCRSWGVSAWRRHTVPLEPGWDVPAPAAPESGVLEAVAALPAKYRWPVYLHYIEGYTAEEIGTILRCPRNTVLSRLQRARKKLKDALKEEWT